MQVVIDGLMVANKREAENLQYHLEQGTHVLCGQQARRYSDGAGGG